MGLLGTAQLFQPGIPVITATRVPGQTHIAAEQKEFGPWPVSFPSTYASDGT